ncbi:MAG: Lipid II flippase FtsW [Actinobacteria bacterium ADurb.Bin346]|nr:MAG: Lipid II flippase FtsW [Actinobacteria bacterium ADurb.Bin346]
MESNELEGLPEQEEKFQRYNVFKLNTEYYFIFVITFLLSVIGIIMVASSSVAVGEQYFNDPYWFIRRQAIWWVISFIIFILFSRINYKFFSRISVFFILISVGLLAVVLFPGVAQVIGGGRRWIDLYFFNLQPSEIAKMALIIFISDSLNKRYREKPVFKNLLWPSLIILLIVTLLIFLEPDFGAVVIIWITVFILFFIGNVRWPHMIGLGSIGIVTLIAYMFMEEYRRERIFAFFYRTGDSAGVNFQVNQSLIALGSGNIFGLGLGNSIQKYSYLPEAQTDFIFAIIGEEFGMVGTLVIILLFLLLAFFCIRVCLKTQDYFGRTIAGAITGLIITQAIINICVVVGLMPVTGLTLPFISFGGSSLLTCMISTGIILNISRQNFTVTKKTEEELRNALHD